MERDRVMEEVVAFLLFFFFTLFSLSLSLSLSPFCLQVVSNVVKILFCCWC